MSSSESSSRRVSSSPDLSVQRRSARTMGCVGFSIVAHAAFLAALAVSQEHIPEIMGNSGVELVAGAASGSEASVVSLVDTSSTSEAPIENAAVAKPEPTGILTDAASEVALPEPKKALPEKALPVKKAVVKTPAPVKVAKVAAPTVTPEITPEPTSEATPSLTSDDEAAPVLLANPPEDTPSSDRPETESVSAPEVVEELPTEAEVPAERQVEAIAAKVEPEAQPESTPPESTPVVAEVSAPVETQSQAPQQVQAAPPASAIEKSQASVSSGSGAGGGSGQQASASGQGSAVNGPIRNSNDLKALRGNPNPVYPARDRLARRQGTTVVLGRISPDGRVTDIKLEKSSGSPSMDAASLQAFRNWRYQSGQEGWVRKPFEFRLVGDAMEVPSPLGKGLKR